MALSIKDPEVERLVRQQAKEYGISITQAILNALREKQANNEQAKQQEIARKLQAVREIQAEVKKLPGYEAARQDWIQNHKAITDALWE